MSKVMIASALLLVSVTLATAQINIGIRGGFLSSTATGTQLINGNEQDIDYEDITGYIVGIPLEIGVSKAFALQAEVNWLSRGYGLDENLGPNTGPLDTRFNVLEIPVLAKIGYTSENFSLAAVIGPSFQYLVSGTFEVQSTDINGQPLGDPVKADIDFDNAIFESFTRSSVYGQAGVQLGVPLGLGKFIVDGRYRFALSDENSLDRVTVKGRGISATAGLLFTLGDY